MKAWQKSLLIMLVIANLLAYGIVAGWFLTPAPPAVEPTPGLQLADAVPLSVPPAVHLAPSQPPAKPRTATPSPTATATTPPPTSTPSSAPATFTPTPTRIRTAVFKVALVPPRPSPTQAVTPQPAPIPVSGGGDPHSPLTPGDTWQTLASHGQAWFLLGHGGVHIDAAVQAQPMDGVALDVFAPGNLDQPIGQGTLQASSGNLVWSGGHWQTDGDWLGRVTNNNSGSIQYKVTSSTKDISSKSCRSYWENIGTSRVYWTVCDNQGS